jgi:hypothetical protein
MRWARGRQNEPRSERLSAEQTIGRCSNSSVADVPTGLYWRGGKGGFDFDSGAFYEA